jgi:hypothetical protein
VVSQASIAEVGLTRPEPVGDLIAADDQLLHYKGYGLQRDHRRVEEEWLSHQIDTMPVKAIDEDVSVTLPSPRANETPQLRSPAIAISRKDDEIGPRIRRLATFEFLQTNPRRTLVQASLVRDTPSKIDGLEARAGLFAKLRQLGPDASLQCVSLLDQICKGQTHKNAKRLVETHVSYSLLD